MKKMKTQMMIECKNNKIEISRLWLPEILLMLHILGFKYAENKLEPPKEVAEVLGVSVDCSEVCRLGELKYVIKESRRTEVLECLENIARDGAVVPHDQRLGGFNLLMDH